MADKIETLGRSLIQHGKDSDRVYLMKLDPSDATTIVARLEELAQEHDYGKIFCKVPQALVESFTRTGYVEEARIPGFFFGRIDGAFLSRFRKPERAEPGPEACEAIEAIRALARAKQGAKPVAPPSDCTIRPMNEEDAGRLAALYAKVFPSYPFPVFDPDYLRRTMAEHIRYYGACREGQLIAAASAETDRETSNAEMTDFATLPEHRGNRLAVHLLRRMEQDMQACGFVTLYTIARALSAGINVTFARQGYRFGGTLVNNTQISGRIESMNVWYKGLAQPEST
jgi:putative beta-lysine N-acetyltransferase